jgi:hypothetical protein
MKSRRFRPDPPPADDEAEVLGLLDKLYAQAKAQFGAAVKGQWFYTGELCPGCSIRPIEVMRYKGKAALSMNAFMYRARGVLIGYLLCEVCATQIFKAAEKNPYQQIPLHNDIERNLIAAYHQHLTSLDA